MRVVNKRHWRGEGVYVGRPSALGNPFVIGRDGDRDAVIEKYRRWLWGKIKQRDPAVMQALGQLGEDSVLICWCAPAPCHGDVIVRAVGWLRSAGV
jgi:hypothetical protein